MIALLCGEETMRIS